jgi:hypothetical protein
MLTVATIHVDVRRFLSLCCVIDIVVVFEKLIGCLVQVGCICVVVIGGSYRDREVETRKRRLLVSVHLT